MQRDASPSESSDHFIGRQQSLENKRRYLVVYHDRCEKLLGF